MKHNAEQLANMEKKHKMEAFRFAQVKYELKAKQRTALAEHPNYEEAMYYAYMGGMGLHEYWRDFEAAVPEVLEIRKS